MRQYRQRSAIEALFRDWKSAGWQWEQSQVRRANMGCPAPSAWPMRWQWEQSQVRRANAHDTVILGLAWATLLTLCLGEESATRLLAQEPQQGQRRPWHARDSLLRFGRDRLWTRLWRQDQIPITWELAHADAPNWSEEYWATMRPDHTLVWIRDRIGLREQVRKAA